MSQEEFSRNNAFNRNANAATGTPLFEINIWKRFFFLIYVCICIRIIIVSQTFASPIFLFLNMYGLHYRLTRDGYFSRFIGLIKVDCFNGNSALTFNVAKETCIQPNQPSSVWAFIKRWRLCSGKLEKKPPVTLIWSGRSHYNNIYWTIMNE